MPFERGSCEAIDVTTAVSIVCREDFPLPCFSSLMGASLIMQGAKAAVEFKRKAVHGTV